MNIEHIAMYVTDLEATRRFFKNSFQLPKRKFAGDQTGYIHLAFSVGSKEKVDTLTECLRADGYLVISGPCTTGDGYYESCVVGPEENLIEITS